MVKLILHLSEDRSVYLFAVIGFNDAWISSSVRPFVSGTNFATNTTVNPHMIENVKNVPAQAITNKTIFSFVYNFSKPNIETHLMFYICLKCRSIKMLPAELKSMRKLKANETIQEPNQLTRVTRLPAEPFTFIGNIWK